MYRPSIAAASSMVGRFMLTSFTRLPGINVIQVFAGSSVLASA